MVILENIDIDIDIDKAILQNIDIDKISNRFKFGISNRATRQQNLNRFPALVKIELLGTNRAERRGPQHRIIMLKSITSVNNWYLMRKRLVLKLD